MSFKLLQSSYNLLFSESQDGGGNSTDDKQYYKLASIIAEKYLHLPIPSSSRQPPPTTLWQPSQDLMPLVAETENVKNTPNIQYPNAILNDDLNDNFDETQLLALVSKPYKIKAKALLEQFDERGNELTWNSSGTVFIDQVSLPQSNFFIIFPLLFKRSKPKNIPGFKDVVLKINQMGLSDFICSRKDVTTHYNHQRITQNNDPENNIPWWYIGD